MEKSEGGWGTAERKKVVHIYTTARESVNNGRTSRQTIKNL